MVSHSMLLHTVKKETDTQKNPTWHYYTCLEAKFQVVLCDNKDSHGFHKEEKGKGDAEGTLTALL